MPPKRAPQQSQQQPKRGRGRPRGSSKAGSSNARRNLSSDDEEPAPKRRRAGNNETASSTAVDCSELEDIWTKLTKGLEDFLNQKTMTHREYMTYYSYVNKFHSPYQATKRLPDGTLAKTAADVVCERLEIFLHRVVAKIIVQGAAKDGEDLLNWYAKEWTAYQSASRVLESIFSFLERLWIRPQFLAGQKIYSIKTLVLSIWRVQYSRIMGTRVVGAVLQQIRKERTGEAVDKRVLKVVLDSYIEMEVWDESPELVHKLYAQELLACRRKKELMRLRFYKEHFEEIFLKMTFKFYDEAIIGTSSTIIVYMNKIEKRLLEEQNRVGFYLHHSTEKELIATLENVLIAKRIKYFQDMVGWFLERHHVGVLGRMYSLCSRVAHGIDYLRRALYEYITHTGWGMLQKFEGTADKDPKGYIFTLVEINDRYEKLIMESFENDRSFLQSLEMAMTLCVNRNAVTVKDEMHDPNKTSELLARACDILLRKSSKMLDEDELENVLQKMMIIFKYTEEKDLFVKIYTRLFGKRLIGETSVSLDAEASFLSKLKTMSGFEYIARMQRMLSDVRTSRDHTAAFKEHLEEANHGEDLCDFNAFILTTGSWPSMHSDDLLLPQKMSRQLEMFTEFYLGKHTGRKLTWQLGQTKGELSASCYATKKLFMANAGQIAVLMLYNTALSYSFADIVKATGMQRKIAAMALASLVKNELLKGEDMSTATDYADDGAFELNLEYKNKKVKIDLSRMVVRSAETKKGLDKDVSVEVERRNVIQTRIVRIMKMRKTITHQRLMTEVLEQLSAHFTPNVQSVKRCISILMEKDYMKRNEENRDTYDYIEG